jgi:lipopolysaccharide heptosyltransferase I
MPPPMSLSALPLGERDRVLLIRLGAVGDVLRTLPALHLIRSSFPHVHLAWIVEDLSLDLLAGHPEIDEVIRFPRLELLAALGSRRPAAPLAGLCRSLRAGRFDVALDFQGSLKSGLVALLSGARRRVGFSPRHCRELSFLLTNDWARPRSRLLNRVEKNLTLAERIGATGDEVAMILPETPDEGARAESIVRTLAPRREPIVVLFPGTSRRQAHKRWPSGRYAALAARIRRLGGAVPVVTWGPGEEALARVVVDASEGGAVLSPLLGLRLLAALLRRAALFVGADTGPMHLAWAVGCPVIALFGPTDPRLNAPLGTGNVVLRRGPTMEDLPVQDVVDAVEGILHHPGAASRPAAHLFPRPAPSRSAEGAAR